MGLLHRPSSSICAGPSYRHASTSAQTRPAAVADDASASIPAFTKEEQDDIFFTHANEFAVESIRPTYSVTRQSAAEGEWLQDNDDVPAVPKKGAYKPEVLFDWRKRAPSRLAAEKNKVYKRRKRATLGDLRPGDPYYDETQEYSTKFLKLLSLEEAEDEAELRHRLSTWSLERLQKEGYCITGLKAYWLSQNQFGRPVACFNFGPGLELPENKFENGTQVLMSRLDPLKEHPVIGSVLSRGTSHIHVCFQSLMDLNEGFWRLDVGRPNIMYERMRAAISHMDNDVTEIEGKEPDEKTQYVLQGTHLRDVLLRSLSESSSSSPDAKDDNGEDGETVCKVDSRTSLADFKNGGAFKYDQRIHSWARRYSQPNPIVIDGDPPLPNVNASQLRAMAAMIGDRVSLIQGPPGTGKTKTIIETVKLLKVEFEVPHPLLVCTYTNVAVDNLVDGLARAGLKPLRVGYSGNVRESLIEHTLDAKLSAHPLHPKLTQLVDESAQTAKEIEDLWRRSRTLELKIKETAAPRKNVMTRASNMRKALFAMQTKQMRRKTKIYAMQQQMLQDVVRDADVICTTCITTACNALNVVDFPVVFLDEASMSTEPASLIPIMKGSRHLALIGDHKQLPPVIISPQAKEGGLGVSLFERLTEEGHVPTVMLDMQYRMHPAISHFPSKEFYDLALLDGTVDAGGNALPGLEPPSSMHLLPDNKRTFKPSVIFLDHTGNESIKSKSRVNITEAHIVMSVVEDLLLSNPHLRGEDIGIIAPYAAQIKLLTRFLNVDAEYKKRFESVLGTHRAMQLGQIEIKTVDGFEGREKEVIVFSTVRNNSAGHIGFLADRKRLNVGLTRAKRGLFVVGSIATLRAGQSEADHDMSVGAGVDAVDALADADVLEAEFVDGKVKSKAKAKGKGKGKGSDSWRRYAEYLVNGNLVVSLTGEELERALYGHVKAVEAQDLAVRWELQQQQQQQQA
uniref:P-loop containing nucleoside triphosphate hydrolase protein n=1 Tax=Psilocybe cubensis TaxID=181762 RepID=A0A8H8CFX0_PSICU